MFIEVNVYRSAHSRAHMHTQAAAWGSVSEAKDAHVHKHTHTGGHYNYHMDWKQT